MNQEIKELIEISKYYGVNKDYVIAGGGNTSFKNSDIIWIKASGQPLAELSEEGLVALSRSKLHMISSAAYSDDPSQREEQVKQDMFLSILEPGKNKRPSVETSLHEIIRYRFVVHLHPTLVNGLLCSRNAKNATLKIFGENVLFVPYKDPGYTLFKKLETGIAVYREKFGKDPQVIFLENHGSFVSADNIAEIKTIYEDILNKISQHVPAVHDVTTLPYNNMLDRALPALRMIFSTGKPLVIRQRNNSLIAQYSQNQQEYHKISHPLTPDIIVYCKTHFLFIEQTA